MQAPTRLDILRQRFADGEVLNWHELHDLAAGLEQQIPGWIAAARADEAATTRATVADDIAAEAGTVLASDGVYVSDFVRGLQYGVAIARHGRPA